MGGEWESIKLGELCEEITVGFVGSMTKEYVDNGIPFFRSKNITAYSVEWGDIRYISPEFHAKLKKSALRPGDVAIVRTGKPGTTCVIPETIKEANCSDLVIVRVDEKRLSPHFLCYFMNSVAAGQQVNSHVVGAVQQHFNVGAAKKIEIPTPSIEEQKRVVDVLKALDDKIQLNHQTNQTLEKMAQALFKSWFVDFDPVIDNALAVGSPIPPELEARAKQRAEMLAQAQTEAGKPSQKNANTGEGGNNPPAYLSPEVRKLFPSEFEETEELGWVPKGWSVKPFGDLLDQTIGGDWGKEKEDEKHTAQAVIVRGTDIPHLISGVRSSAPRRWVEPKKLKTRKLEDGDIVVEVSGGSPTQPTGRSIMFTQTMLDRLGGVVEPASFCRKFKPISLEFGLLLSLHLQKIYSEGKTWEYQNQSTGISNFQTKVFLSNEMIVVPKGNIKDEFYRIVRPLIDKASNNEQICLEKLRDTLLPKLISGELLLPSTADPEPSLEATTP